MLHLQGFFNLSLSVVCVVLVTRNCVVKHFIKFIQGVYKKKSEPIEKINKCFI